MSVKIIRIFMLATTASLIGASGLAATAFAQAPQSQDLQDPSINARQVPGQNMMQNAPRISVSQMAAKLEQAGYAIRDIEQKSYGWEVEVIDKNYDLLELKIDMQGNITRQKYDD